MLEKNDNFINEASALSKYFYDRLNVSEEYSYITLPYDFSAIAKNFQSEYSAKQALKGYLRKPYEVAKNIMTIEHKDCIVNKTTERYKSIIESCFNPIMDKLKELYTSKGKTEDFYEIYNLIKECGNTFEKAFNEEITENRKYYDMYDFNYFVESIDIEEHDYRTGTGFLKVIESLFPNSIEYSCKNFYGIISEMEKDLNEMVSEFHKSVHRKYLSYIKSIINAIEK